MANMKNISKMKKTLAFIGERDILILALMRAIFTISNEVLHVGNNDFEKRLSKLNPNQSFIILNTSNDVYVQVNKWLWDKLRLNEKQISKDLAGLPIIVLGMDKKFFGTPEGQVFQDFPTHHKYLTKPLNLYRFLVALNGLCPIDPSSLCVIKKDTPDEILEKLELHDLKDISKKFVFRGSDEELKKRFNEIETKLKILEDLKKNKKKVAKLREEVKALKEEIIKRRGNIWQ